MSLVSGTVKGIPASRIFRLARTSRWAIVAAGTRNARAISSVCKSAKRAQRERHLRLERERGVATSEDQTQTIVGDFAVVEIRFVDDLARKELRMRFQFFLQTSLPSQTIDGFVFGGLDDPGARRFGNAVSAPLVNGGGERFLRGVFGELEVAELPDERGHNAAPVRAVDRIDSDVGI